MLRTIVRNPGENFAHDPAVRGYRAVYRDNAVNHCPGCGRTHWHIGRVSAECAFCATALPLQEASSHSASPVHTCRNRPVFFQHAER